MAASFQEAGSNNKHDEWFEYPFCHSTPGSENKFLRIISKGTLQYTPAVAAICGSIHQWEDILVNCLEKGEDPNHQNQIINCGFSGGQNHEKLQTFSDEKVRKRCGVGQPVVNVGSFKQVQERCGVALPRPTNAGSLKVFNKKLATKMHREL